MMNTVLENPSDRKACIITGPTSGIGCRTALELAKHGTVVLVGGDRGKLNEMCRRSLSKKGSRRCRWCATCLILRACGARLRRSSRSISRLSSCSTTRASSRCARRRTPWEMTLVTNHLGSFARQKRSCHPRRRERGPRRHRRRRS